DELAQKGQAGPLPDAEAVLLRRAEFGIAECHFDMTDYPEALRLYQALQRRYRGKVEALIACNRIWRLVGLMTQSPAQLAQARDAAKEAVALAQEDFAKMPADSDDFKGPGVWTHDEWKAWLTIVRGELVAAPAAP